MNVGMMLTLQCDSYRLCAPLMFHAFFFFFKSSRAALDRAAVLLKMSMGGLRIDNHWGSGGGQRPVVQLIKEVNYIDQTGEETGRKQLM